MAIASKQALGSDDAEVPSGYITVSARELMDAIGVRNYGTKSRRAIIESVLRWSEVQLSIVEMSPGSKKIADAKEITNFTRLINLSRITQDLGTNAAEITFSVPRSAAKLYGYQDFCKVPSYYNYPPLVSFMLDYLAPHKPGFAVKASTIWRASMSQANYINFVKILYETLAWFVAEGYMVELRTIDDEALAAKVDDDDGNPIAGLQFRISKPSVFPAFDSKLEARKRKRGEWYRYLPRQRAAKLGQSADQTEPTVH